MSSAGPHRLVRQIDHLPSTAARPEGIAAVTETQTRPIDDGSTPRPVRPTLLVRLADWSYRRRRRVLLMWVVLLIVTVMAAGQLGGENNFTFTTPGSDSEKAQNLLESGFPARSGEDVSIVFKALDDKTVDDPN